MAGLVLGHVLAYLIAVPDPHHRAFVLQRTGHEYLPAMAEEAHAIRRLLDNNPRDITRDEILALYRAAY